MTVVDSLLYDTVKITRYKANPAYEYGIKPVIEQESLFDVFTRWINKLIGKVFGGAFEENVVTPTLIVCFIAAIAVVAYFLYKKRPELFMFTSKNKLSVSPIEEENIHRIDFDREIAAALDSNNYQLAIRLEYLHSLQLLSDSNMIDWQIHKTPTEYLYELRRVDMRDVFKKLTNRFLEIRFGNYKATRALYDEARACVVQINVLLQQKREGGYV